ncbi:Oidioi.mRNA.OKI2018_I69.PAR.g11536.t1.cds [Oikopleura dioica]|uniref:Oidioi.mRNA.OKI2018_I69.PAR.g11536.t1.cds n=1 Tax=Oikopleura dioica TaxID=34765 RepID=A0ABN7S2H1_OIKDI|nr:Oidioi.mRNA.OKI2018_I69.PAR.g11536.t1.cds [Oikopleura dioica]
MASIIDFVRRRRKETQARFATNARENFVAIKDTNNSAFALTPQQIEWFYPSAKKKINWGYGKDHMGVAARADIKFLKEFIQKRPIPKDYFEEREKQALIATDSHLRFPPSYYIKQRWEATQMYFNSNQTKGRLPQHYNRYTITVLNDVDLPDLVEKLVTNLNGMIQIYLDCYCSALSEATAIDEITGQESKIEVCKIVYPNMAGKINDTTEITDHIDLEKLRSEAKFENFTSRLTQRVFESREAFRQSNVRLNRILCYQITINAFPPSWRFA